MEIVESNKLLPKHQFGFRKKHSTIEQVHRLVEQIYESFEKKEYCAAAFLDISQAFDRVWHDGLLYKLKKTVPTNYYIFIKSYLEHRHFFVKHCEEVTGLYPISAGVPQGSVMGPILYILFTADLPVSSDVLIGTFADDTAALAVDLDPKKASAKLQNSLNEITAWLQKWRIKPNESKSIQVTFTTRKDTCPPVQINGSQIQQAAEAKYLGIYLDRRLTWRKHIFTKRKALGLQLRKMFWFFNRKSKLSVTNKLLLYHSILKPIWTYGIQLWGTAANSNLEILQRFQSKVLRSIVNAAWYITNAQLHRELQVKTIKEEIKAKAHQYKSRILNHPNELAAQLMSTSQTFKRLRRLAPQDLII